MAPQNPQIPRPMSSHVTHRVMHSSNDAQPRGFTRSVTISHGIGEGQPRVQVFSSNGAAEPFPQINFNNTNNIQMNMGGMVRAGNPFDLLQGMQQMGPMMFFGADGNMQPQSRGVSEEFIDNLPPMKAGKEADCNICLEKVGENGNKSCELPCGHAFDKNCLVQWLKEKDSCPVCRAKLDQGSEPQPNN